MKKAAVRGLVLTKQGARQLGGSLLGVRQADICPARLVQKTGHGRHIHPIGDQCVAYRLHQFQSGRSITMYA